jgi:hypothetical protein
MRRRCTVSLEAKVEPDEGGEIWRAVAEPDTGPRGQLDVLGHLVFADEAQVERVLFSL